MSTANGLTKTHSAPCCICGAVARDLDGDPAYAASELRKLGWRPARTRRVVWTSPDGMRQMTENETTWYCPKHEQMRPSLKKNQAAS